MLFSYDWLQTFFEKKLPSPGEMKCLILKHSFEVEDVLKSGNDTVFDVNILSNRPDCFGHVGMAREVGAALGYKLNLPKIKKSAVKTVPARSLISVQIENGNDCPRYCAKIVTGIKVGQSPKWLQERLVACGLRPINNIVDATNYVMLEAGQPLHAFDLEKIDNGSSKSKIKKIFIRRAQNSEIIETLDNKKYKLGPSVLTIADSAGALAVAGIKGGKRAEIEPQTKDIVIEAANFNQRLIRLASRNLGLQTDASLRFEHGLDPNEAESAATRTAELIKEIAGGQILSGVAESYLKKTASKKITLNLETAERLLGAKVQSAVAKKILERLGFSVRKGSGQNIEVLVPTRRSDITLEQDLIEEIGRVSGYDNILPQMPQAAIVSPLKNYFWQWKKIATDALVQAGYTETRNSTFLSKTECQNFGTDLKNLLEVKNPVNLDLQFLRPSLLVGLFRNAAKNPLVHDLCQFEVGKIFGADLKMEPTMIAGIDKAVSFFKTKGTLKYVFAKLGIPGFEYRPLEIGVNNLFVAGRSAKVFADERQVGVVGEVDAEICKKFGIPKIVAFELSMDILSIAATERVKCQLPSIFPEAIRDISIDVPKNTALADIIEVVRDADSGILRNYSIPGNGDNPHYYPANNLKNILISFRLHSSTKTLENKEINSWQEKIVAAIEKNPEWKVKK